MREDETNLTYNDSDMERMEPIPSLNLPDLIEQACLSPKDGSPYRVFICTGRPLRNRVCPYCGSISIRNLGYMPEPRLIHDVNIGVVQTDIVLKVDRYACNDCGATFSRTFDGIMENRQMTERLYDQIRRDAFRMSFSEVAAMYGYSDTTIANIFDEYARELEAKRGAIVAPYALGIDEKHIVHTMRAVFVNIETGELLEIRPDNKKKDILGTIEGMVDYDTNIRIVTMDMSNGYKSYVEECLPYAKIIVDKYHVYQDLYQKVTKTRTKILEAIARQVEAEPDTGKRQHLRDVRDLVIKNPYLFKFGPAKLAEKQHRIAAMADVCSTFPEFNHLRLLKEGFERIYTCSTREDAESYYEEWKALVPPTGSRQIEKWEERYHVKAELFADFRVFMNAMNKWRKEVFNYFDGDCEYTNAAAEGTNHLIQNMNRVGNGYSFARLRAKALFWHTAAPRMTYSFNKRSIKKERPANKGTHAFVSFNSFNIAPSSAFGSYYEDVVTVEGVEERKAYEPLSVFDYLGEASEGVCQRMR